MAGDLAGFDSYLGPVSLGSVYRTEGTGTTTTTTGTGTGTGTGTTTPPSTTVPESNQGAPGFEFIVGLLSIATAAIVIKKRK